MVVSITRAVRPFIALALASAGLVACGSPPTAPSSRSPVEAAPPATASASAAAQTIKITGGTLTVVSGVGGPVMLKGSHGFRFDGRVQGGNDPSGYCNPCQPGATVPFAATWLGLDMPGTARVQGEEFTIQGDDGTSMYITMAGSFVAPAHVTESTSVTTPFTGTGILARGNPLPALDLTASGHVTFMLAWEPFLGGWVITHSSFDFGNGGGND